MTPPRLLLLLALLLSPSAHAENLPFTQRTYCNLVWEIRKDRFGVLTKGVEHEPVTGSFWVVEANGEKLAVTAAHNLGFGITRKPTPNKRTLALISEPILGVLAYGVAEVGLPQDKADWMAIRPAHSSVVQSSKVFTLASSAPKIGQKVQVWGHPTNTKAVGKESPAAIETKTTSAAHASKTEATITSVNPMGTFIMLNSTLDPGYSGGVVLNSDDQAIGVVVTSSSEGRHSTALVLTAAHFSKLSWKQFSEVSRQNFNQP